MAPPDLVEPPSNSSSENSSSDTSCGSIESAILIDCLGSVILLQSIPPDYLGRLASFCDAGEKKDLTLSLCVFLILIKPGTLATKPVPGSMARLMRGSMARLVISPIL